MFHRWQAQGREMIYLKSYLKAEIEAGKEPRSPDFHFHYRVKVETYRVLTNLSRYGEHQGCSSRPGCWPAREREHIWGPAEINEIFSWEFLT